MMVDLHQPKKNKKNWNRIILNPAPPLGADPVESSQKPFARLQWKFETPSLVDMSIIFSSIGGAENTKESSIIEERRVQNEPCTFDQTARVRSSRSDYIADRLEPEVFSGSAPTLGVKLSSISSPQTADPTSAEVGRSCGN
ncbi:hypothetical protein ACOSQ2_019167 [Xanthoceras sorbifolium]